MSRLASREGVTGMMTRSAGSTPSGLPPLGGRAGASRPVSEASPGRPWPAAAPPCPDEPAWRNGTGEPDLRDIIDEAREGLFARIDRLLGSGRLLDRHLVVDLARFLNQAGPAVDAYEQLLARVAAADDDAGER